MEFSTRPSALGAFRDSNEDSTFSQMLWACTPGFLAFLLGIAHCTATFGFSVCPIYGLFVVVLSSLLSIYYYSHLIVGHNLGMRVPLRLPLPVRITRGDLLQVALISAMIGMTLVMRKFSMYTLHTEKPRRIGSWDEHRFEQVVRHYSQNWGGFFFHRLSQPGPQLLLLSFPASLLLVWITLQPHSQV